MEVQVIQAVDEELSPVDYKLNLFNSSTAWLAARAVKVIKVRVGFWVLALVIQAPSVTNTFLQ
jgi:hypothetical protein